MLIIFPQYSKYISKSFSKIPFFLQQKANQLFTSLSTAISCWKHQFYVHSLLQTLSLLLIGLFVAGVLQGNETETSISLVVTGKEEEKDCSRDIFLYRFLFYIHIVHILCEHTLISINVKSKNSSNSNIKFYILNSFW